MVEHPSVSRRAEQLLKKALLELADEIETYEDPATCIGVAAESVDINNGRQQGRAQERKYWADVIRHRAHAIG